jgi:3D (Asp-Asp-Asp) domain-containing protein
MILVGSVWRRVLVSAVAALACVWLYEATILDSQNRPWLTSVGEESTTQPPPPGLRVTFGASAYCKGLVTKAGVAAQTGVAADPSLLPLGSVVQIDAPETSYDGIYSVVDTGPAVQGRQIDIYMWSCHEALRFGRRPVQLTVLRQGWNPQATTPSFVDRMFKRPGNGNLDGPAAPKSSRQMPMAPDGNRVPAAP